MYYACKTILVTSLMLLISIGISIDISYLWHIGFILRIYEYISKCLVHGRLT